MNMRIDRTSATTQHLIHQPVPISAFSAFRFGLQRFQQQAIQKGFHSQCRNIFAMILPNSVESRHDIIQAVTFGTPEGVVSFCEGIQKAAPIDSFVTPEPWDMPGYDSKVIMAAGAFVSGSSIELSADGPIKPPYAVYFQGGLTWQHAKFGILTAYQSVKNAGLIRSEL